MEQSTGLKRTGFKRKLPGTEPKPKMVSCKECKVRFLQPRLGAKVCSPECAILFAEKQRQKIRLAQDKKKRAEAKKERMERKAKLEEYKPLSYWEKIAETHCNAYIRARDPDVCISCGVRQSSAFQAGHYISVGANKTLRYNEININKQCIKCNLFEGSNAIEYRKGMIEKYGIEAVEKLEGWHPPIKLTVEYLKEVADHYKAKLKTLKGKT